MHHAMTTVGGKSGHLARRALHVATLIIPCAYYRYASAIARWLHLSLSQLLLLCFLLLSVLEALRLWRGWLCFGQRSHEKKRISSFVWGAASILLVLWLAPGGYAHGIRFALPLIACLALVDPCCGILRRLAWRSYSVLLCGYLLALLVWCLACFYYQISYVYAALLPPITVLAEWPNLSWIDDNALMLCIPLACVLLLYTFGV